MLFSLSKDRVVIENGVAGMLDFKMSLFMTETELTAFLSSSRKFPIAVKPTSSSPAMYQDGIAGQDQYQSHQPNPVTLLSSLSLTMSF